MKRKICVVSYDSLLRDGRDTWVVSLWIVGQSCIYKEVRAIAHHVKIDCLHAKRLGSWLVHDVVPFEMIVHDVPINSSNVRDGTAKTVCDRLRIDSKWVVRVILQARMNEVVDVWDTIV